MLTGIIFSSDNEAVDVCFDCFSEVGIGLVKQNDFASFIYKLQQDLFDLIIFDSDKFYSESLKYVKIIRKIKPKTPLIVFSENIEKVDGGKIYQEGIFHLEQKPLQKNILKEVIKASVNSLETK
jgi:DNA-binding NtrC family response regulator